MGRKHIRIIEATLIGKRKISFQPVHNPLGDYLGCMEANDAVYAYDHVFYRHVKQNG